MSLTGNLQKMRAAIGADGTVEYTLSLGEEDLTLNPLLGRRLSITWEGVIHCVACGRVTKKSFNQGYCYPCVQSLAECDLCIVSPDRCHHRAGTCRDPQWAEGHCMQPHYVYLSNTSALKVGITRATQIPTRWIDQGATQALPIFRTATRHQAGLIEAALREHVADRTDWRRMLKGDAEPLELAEERERLLAACGAVCMEAAGAEPVEGEVVALRYPVLEYPQKAVSLNLDKKPVVEDVLLGIKGQYLIFAGGALNVRKFAGYRVRVAA
ncbi:MAG: DUF2797 domain-containing protein [Thiohalomonadaceae bacterium]